MLRSSLDHIVVAAPSLAAGAEYVHRTLGVRPEAGGAHPRMGTHNRLLSLGGQTYLEIIAIDPGAPPPGRPRWFQLDDPETHRTPRLAAWVVRTNDIRAAVADSVIPLGDVESMSRGRLEWLITVPADGRLPLDGIAPALIQWPDRVHPAPTLEDRGFRLLGLQGFHPAPEKIDALLAAIGFQGGFTVAPLPRGKRPYLVAQIQTPSGPRELPGVWQNERR